MPRNSLLLFEGISLERKTLERMTLAKGLNGGERPLDKAFEVEHGGREIVTESEIGKPSCHRKRPLKDTPKDHTKNEPKNGQSNGMIWACRQR